MQKAACCPTPRGSSLHPALWAVILLLVPASGLAQATCSLDYALPADLDVEIPSQAQDSDFMAFAWSHFLALNAPEMGGQISVTGDNPTQWSKWSSTADLLNQTGPGPSGSRFYPQVCTTIPNYQQYRVIQQTGKVDDSFLEAQVGGLSEHPVIDAAGHFLRYEILISPAMYDQIVAEGWNKAEVLNGLEDNVVFACGDQSYTGGDPSDPRMGAIAIKVAWRDASGIPAELAPTFHTEELLVFTPSYRNSSGVETCELKTMAMVGMHIGHKTVKQPNWVWATFEHLLNAPDCTSLPPGPGTQQANMSCPTEVTEEFSFASSACTQAGDQTCAPCNTPPAHNGVQCVNPFVDPDGTMGWCLDLPPNPVGGISRLCRQVPVGIGHCTDNAAPCDDDQDCASGATCEANYPAANAQNAACVAAIENAAGGSGSSPWSHYQLISSQWEANSYDTCQNAAAVIASTPNGPVNQSVLREQVVLSVNAGTNTTRPILGNTSMESYDRANCLGCHARSYLNGRCSDDASQACSTNADCGTGTCNVISTDLMYFLKLEVSEPPALRLPGSLLTYFSGSRWLKTPPALTVVMQAKNVVTGHEQSMDDPRCNGAPRGTVKASLRVHGSSQLLESGRIDLPCQGWSRQQGPRGATTYRYLDLKGRWGRCRSVVVRDQRSVHAFCTGEDLPDVRTTNGEAVRISLVTGRRRHCGEFSAPGLGFGLGSAAFFASAGGRPQVCPDL